MNLEVLTKVQRRWVENLIGITGDKQDSTLSLISNLTDRLARVSPQVAPAVAESAGIPAGMVLVPLEPTDTMVAAGWDAHPGKCGTGESPVTDCYKAMLAAAPSQGAAATHGKDPWAKTPSPESDAYKFNTTIDRAGSSVAAPSSEAQSAPDWQPMETAPQDGTDVVLLAKWNNPVWDKNYHRTLPVIGRYANGEWHPTLPRSLVTDGWSFHGWTPIPGAYQ